ncbi:MAG: hypothetical protein Q7U82_08455 [Gammaproteobacteria bacterium]|nr:hypothetical protein [Gammaproteobacteria bacterium]
MKKRTVTEVSRSAKPAAGIAPVAVDLPAWRHRKVQPLELKDVSASGLIMEERKDGR